MKTILTAILSLALILTLAGCAKTVTWNGKTEEFVELLMVEDISDPYRYIGLVDYVFVGTVEEILDNVLPEKAKKHEDHFSTYKLLVDRNLKGELIEEIVVSKMGGMERDGTMCLAVAEMPSGTMIRDTGLPELGKQYIFLAYAQPDGSLTLSELFDNREYSEELLDEYKDYCENEICFDRERFVSSYAK